MVDAIFALSAGLAADLETFGYPDRECGCRLHVLLCSRARFYKVKATHRILHE